MRRIISTFLVLIFISTGIKAQNNLVPNWSFENITNCPHYYSPQPTILFAPTWQNPNPGTSDLYCSCDTIVNVGLNAPGCGAPLNVAGFQQARTGGNYSGLLAWGKPTGLMNNVREYIQTQLLDSLIASRNYCISFYVNLADSAAQYSTSRIGAYISNNPANVSSQYLINVLPQIQNPYGNLLNDRMNWVLVEGIYQGLGGEKYITIGNFFDDLNTDTAEVINNSSGRSYYFVDDVSIVEYNKAFAGADTNVCRGIKIDRNLGKTFGAQYNWSTIMGDINSIDSMNVASPLFSPSVTTTYVMQKQQCGILSYDTLTIYVPQEFLAVASNDTIICAGDTISISALNNCAWCNHQWSTGETTLQINTHPVSETTYIFTQIDSCFTTTDHIVISIEYCNSPIVIPPNIFTPNGDEINDVWLPQIKNELAITNYYLTIFDRWGLKIFETEKYSDAWDGHTTAGLSCNGGTYYYVIDYTDIKINKTQHLRGFLELIASPVK